MWKTLLSRVGSCLFLITSVATADAQLTSLTEGFDTTGNSVPTPTGIFAQSQPWINVNNSDVPNTTAFNWQHGDSGTFIWTAQSPVGSTTSFAQVSFLSTNGTILSDWLLTPVLTLEAGATFSFYTVAAKGTTFANDLQVYISTSGSSTNVGSDAQTPTGGVFTLLPGGDLNPTLAVNGYPLTQPNGWTLETFTLTSAEIGAATTGRIGLRYFIPNTATQGSGIGVDTFSFADPTVFTRTVSGNWTDTTGWTPNAVPNGTNVTAQLVNPGSGTNSVDLSGGTFTVNQLQFSGTNAGTWNVTNGTIIFDGTNPTFLNQGDSNGLVGSLPNLQLNASTTFEIDNASAVTDVTGAITGTGGLTKTGSGTLLLTGTNTYSGGTTISAGTLQIGSGGTAGSIAGNVTDNGVLAFDRSDTVTFAGVISGTGVVTQIGTGTTILTGANTYSGGTTISSGTLQIGNGGTAGSITGNVTDNGVLAFDRSDSVTFAGAISGTGSVTQVGTGTTILTGTNTYSGGTTISSGTLQIGNGGTAGSITGNVTDNGVLAFDRSDSVTFAGAISGTGSVTQIGTGTTILTGTNTYSGGTTISSGTLQIGNGGTAGSITGNVTDNGVLAFDRSDTLTLAGAISGTGSVAQIGTGTTILTGTNTYSGGTTISSGTLQIGNGGTAGSITGNVTDNGVLAFDRSDSVTFAGAISGTGGVTQIGTGTTILTGTNTYGGGTTISAGTLQVGSASALSQNSDFTVNSTLDLHGFNSTIGSLSGTGSVLNNGATASALTVGNDNASTTFSGVLQDGTGALQLTKSGTGTLTLTGTNTYSGGTTISSGTLQIGNGGTAGSITGNVTDNGVLAFDRSDTVTFVGAISSTGGVTQTGTGTTILTGINTYSGGTTISSGTLQIGNGGTAGSITGNVTDNGVAAFDRSDTMTFAGVISGTGSFTQIGTGTTILTGTNTYSGGTTISSGTLQIGNGGTSGSITGNVTDNGVLAFDRSDTVTFAGAIGGTGGVTQIGTGTTILTDANAYSGGTTISSGTLQIGNGGTAGSITGNVTDNGVLGFDRSDTVIFAGAISGTGSVTQIGTGTTILTGTNTYSGGTTISSGTLQIGNGGTAGSITGNVTDNGVLAFDRSDSVTFAGAISGTGAVTQIGTGTTILTGTNTYIGGTTTSSGTLQIGNGGTAGSITGNVTDNGVLAFDRSDSVTFPGAISGTGGVTQIGAGTTILTGTNTYSGGTTISAGTLQVGSASALSQNSDFTVNSILDLHGFNSTIGSLSGTGSVLNNGATASALTVGNDNASTTFSGVLQDGTGALQLTKSGTGTLTLTGTNTYSGGTTISSGTLQIGNGGTAGSITGNVTGNGVLAFDRSDTVTFAGAISGTGALVQLGSGVLTLTGASTYSGGTTISGGTLQVGNGGTTGSIIGNVVDNGTLIFNRSNTLSFGGVISGTGSLQQNGSGITILSGANTYTGGTVLDAGTLVVNGAEALGQGNVVVNGGFLRADPQPINVVGNYTQNAGGTLQLQVAGANAGQYDFLNVGGNANLGGTLQLISLGYLPKAGDLLKVVTTGGVVSGQFAHFSSPFTTGPGLNTIDLVYGRNSVQLQFLNVTTPISPVIPTVPTTPSSPPAVPPKVVATLNFASFAFTPNQRSTATLLDQVELDPRTANLIGFLFKQPLANLPGDFEQISPAGLTAFYEISFSGANIQKLNLEGRFDDIRNGANGFRSNVKVNGASVNLEDKATADRNSSKAVVEPILQPGPENRWGVWMTGFGDFVSVDADSNAQGYDFTTGGVSLGIDYRILDHLAIGVMGDYAHTWTSLNPSGHIDVDTGRGGVYATWFNHGLYLNAAIYGGHSSYDSSRSTLGGLAVGGTEGAEFSTFAGGGYDFNFGHVTVGPIASIQYTYVNIDGFSEESSLAPLEIHSASAESLRTDFGFRASFHWQIGKILVEPAIKAAWEHEYKYSALPITAGFAAIPGPSATFFGPSEGHDSAVVSAGITVQLTPMIATYLNYDGQLGRDRYDSNAVTGGVRVAF